eukprot:Rhum_TRINITY_DN14467_c20_g1::Rhum_TRINITY_DN14467_c20_g1_i1::g.91821::m.91821
MGSMADTYGSDAVESYLYKLLVVGDAGVGKTSLVRRYCDHVFTANYKATLGVEFNSKTVKCGKKEIQAQLWDIAGQEIFGHMTRVFYRGAVGAIVVCDPRDPNTLYNAVKWKEDIDRKVQLPWAQAIPCLLVVTKLDLGAYTLPSDIKSLSEFAAEHGFAGYAEVSAKDGTNVNEAFLSLVRVITKLADNNPLTHPAPSDKCIKLQTRSIQRRVLCCGQ